MATFRFNKENILPSLREKLEAHGLPGKFPTVGMLFKGPKELDIPDRHKIIVSEGKQLAEWVAPPLRELFRGDVIPPPSMGDYPPEEHAPYFYYIEHHVVTFAQVIGDPTDKEFIEVYSNLRRRPDGRSLGPLHDFVWQVCALLLALEPLSALQFEAIIGRLASSAKHFSMGLVSRTYIHFARQTVTGALGY